MAKALGITEEKLKSMSQQEVMKLARDNGVNLNDYARPGEPPQQSQNRQQQPNSVFRP